MNKIKNIEGLTLEELNMEINNGGKFVVFKYCYSLILFTTNDVSDIYFIKPRESTMKYSLWFTIITLLFGWWGIPWGPIYSIGALYTNIIGGTDVTFEVIDSMNSKIRNQQDENRLNNFINSLEVKVRNSNYS